MIAVEEATYPSNAGLPVYSGENDAVESSAQTACLPNGQPGVPNNAFHTADGSHLDALVPLRANGSLGSFLCITVTVLP